MSQISDKLIVALDVPTLKEAGHFVDILYPEVKMFKVGSQLYTACGPEVVEMVGKKGAKVFLDLKWHDIPNTVCLATGTGTNLSFQAGSAKAAGSQIGMAYPVFMMTVHTKGGREMLKAAVNGATEKAKELKINRPFIVGVTRLTSDEDTGGVLEQVLAAARLAKDAGLAGVVCSPLEAAAVRRECGPDFLIVTPGIRAKDAPTDDQKRTATASEAIAAGADFIVVGRPILKAKDPLQVASKMVSACQKSKPRPCVQGLGK